jgi:hypothetical protein
MIVSDWWFAGGILVVMAAYAVAMIFDERLFGPEDLEPTEEPCPDDRYW